MKYRYKDYLMISISDDMVKIEFIPPHELDIEMSKSELFGLIDSIVNDTSEFYITELCNVYGLTSSGKMFLIEVSQSRCQLAKSNPSCDPIDKESFLKVVNSFKRVIEEYPYNAKYEYNDVIVSIGRYLKISQSYGDYFNKVDFDAVKDLVEGIIIEESKIYIKDDIKYIINEYSGIIIYRYILIELPYIHIPPYWKESNVSYKKVIEDYLSVIK